MKLLTTILSIGSLLLTSREVKCSPDALTKTLAINIIEDTGFGSSNNVYSWSMEIFKDQIYVGTFNRRFGRLGVNLMIAGRPGRFYTYGAEIHRGTKNKDDGTWSWEKVVGGGLEDRANCGVRKMLAINDYLYAVTVNPTTGMEVWKSYDGTNWEIVVHEGFGSSRNSSGRGLASFNGYIYVGTENRRSGGQVWRRELAANGDLKEGSEWDMVIDRGIDTSDNYWLSDFTVHNTGTEDYLYAGTWNRETGGELWRSNDGETWEVLFRNGNGNPKDWAIMKLYSYEGRLYLGTMNWATGASLLVSKDITATKFNYLWVDGNGNPDNAYTWYITAYNNRLYVSTFHTGGDNEFDLYSSKTPSIGGYEVETLDAFGIAPDMYGIRCMVVYHGSLLMGGAARSVPTKVFEGKSLVLHPSPSATPSVAPQPELPPVIIPGPGSSEDFY